MLLKYIRTKQVYNTRIKDNLNLQWVHLSDHEIKKYGGHNELIKHLKAGNIIQHKSKLNTYSTHLVGDYDLSLLEVPFPKEPLFNIMYNHLLNVELPQAKENNNELFWFNIFLTFRHILKSLFFNVDDFSGRIHTPITNIKKEYRKDLILYGESTVSLDIATFQPTLLAKILMDNLGENDFSKYVYEQNDIYILIQEKLKLHNREEAKKEFCTILFGRGNNKLKELFSNSSWLEWINDFKDIKIKENPSQKGNYTNLVWLLQNYEVKLMKRIWNTLVINDIPFLTVHDEIIVPKSLELDAYYIMQLVLDKELEHYKINVS